MAEHDPKSELVQRGMSLNLNHTIPVTSAHHICNSIQNTFTSSSLTGSTLNTLASVVDHV